MEFNLKRLKAERVAQSKTQQQVADYLGITRNAYTKKETGRSSIGVDEFSKILQCLEIPENKIHIFFDINVPEKERVN